MKNMKLTRSYPSHSAVALVDGLAFRIEVKLPII